MPARPRIAAIATIYYTKFIKGMSTDEGFFYPK